MGLMQNKCSVNLCSDDPTLGTDADKFNQQPLDRLQQTLQDATNLRARASHAHLTSVDIWQVKHTSRIKVLVLGNADKVL